MIHVSRFLRGIGRYWLDRWTELIRPATPEEIAKAKRTAGNHGT